MPDVVAREFARRYPSVGTFSSRLTPFDRDVDEAAQFHEKLQKILPPGWKVYRQGLAFEFRGPRGLTEGTQDDEARITFWFSDRFADSTVLNGRDPKLPRIGSWGITRLGQVLFTRNPSAIESWPTFLDDVYWILPVEHVAFVGRIDVDQEIDGPYSLGTVMRDAGTRIDVRIDESGNRIDHIASDEFRAKVQDLGIARETQLVVTGYLPKEELAATDEERQSVKRRRAWLDQVARSPVAYGTRIVRLPEYIAHLQQLKRDGLANPLPEVKDGNSIEVPVVAVPLVKPQQPANPAQNGRADDIPWGPESDGLRCRLVAVPVATDDDSPEIQPLKQAYGRGDDVTFAVELENVSDERLTLFGVRDAATDSQKDSVPSTATGWVPHVFEFEFSDAEGKPIPRVSRVYWDRNWLSGAPPVQRISPGQSVVVVLRPALFQPPMNDVLPSGRFRAKVRYRGLGEKDVELLRKAAPPNKPFFGAWSGSVVSNEVEVSVSADPPPPQLNWGEVKDGLQAAVEFRTPGDPESDKSRGNRQTARLLWGDFHVRNVSDRPISFVIEGQPQFEELTVTNAATGRTQQLKSIFYTGVSVASLVRWTLKPGEVAVIPAWTAAGRIGESGEYTAKCGINFGGLMQTGGDPEYHFPKDGDYRQTLVAGDTELALRSQSPEGGARQKPSTRPAALPRATLTGRFVYDGEAPPRKDLWPQFAEIDATQRQPPGPDGRFSGVEATYREFLKQNIRPSTLDSSLLVDETGGIANVVIWVTSKELPWTPPADLAQRPVTIRLKDGHFSPRMTVAMVGQPVVVENLDPVPFGIHTMFRKNSDFNPLLPSGTDVEPFHWTGVAAEPFPAHYRCDQGPWTDGWLFVAANPYVAVSRADGTFTLPDLPPGEWEFRVWHERRGYLQHWPKGVFRRVIEPGQNDLGEIRLKPELLAER